MGITHIISHLSLLPAVTVTVIAFTITQVAVHEGAMLSRLTAILYVVL